MQPISGAEDRCGIKSEKAQGEQMSSGLPRKRTSDFALMEYAAKFQACRGSGSRAVFLNALTP
jgi:hypothetical protein